MTFTRDRPGRRQRRPDRRHARATARRRPPAARWTRCPSVIVTDSGGNPVPNVSITFAVASGGGSASGAIGLTDRLRHSHGRRLDPGSERGLEHPHSERLEPGRLAGDLHRDRRGRRPASHRRQRRRRPDGAPPARRSPPCRACVVSDAHGNPVTGVSVTFSVASGGGTATGTAAVTDASGIATVGGWTLGATAGGQHADGHGAGLAGLAGHLHARPATVRSAGMIAPHRRRRPDAPTSVRRSARTRACSSPTQRQPVDGVSVTFGPDRRRPARSTLTP